ncbi:MAG: GNAT family N-acetyltransferase [Actinomycetota bacterium]
MLQPPHGQRTATSGAGSVTCRPLAPLDVATTARLHIALLGEGLFPRLGPAFVRRWHLTFVDNPHASAHVVTNADGDVLAFILATTDQAAYVGETLRSAKWPLALRGAWGLARRPGLALGFLRTRLRRYARRIVSSGPSTTASSGAVEGPVAVVHAIVTTHAARGRGLGRELMARFEADVAAAGVTRMELLTDEGGGAVEFYRRLGWTAREVRTNRDGRRMVLFCKRTAA